MVWKVEGLPTLKGWGVRLTPLFSPIYVDDIIFGSTNQDFCEEFGKMMANEFEMSMIGELSYFLGLQIKQLKNGTFVSQGKYIKDMIKKFGMSDSKVISTPMGTNGNFDSDASGNMMDQKLYRSMIGSVLFVMFA